jgi:negative regulator of replication initiation
MEDSMMPTIRIDDDVWRYLQGKAKPFEDTPNDVLRRELGLDTRPDPNPQPSVAGSIEVQQRGRGGHLEPDKDYTGRSVRGYRLNGSYSPCYSFKDVLIKLSNQLRREDQATFDKAALMLPRGTKRAYFARNRAELKFGEELVGGGLFVETNLNANLIVRICRALLRELGRDASKFEVD